MRDEDRVIARTVDSAWRCEHCGERFTSNRLRLEHQAARRPLAVDNPPRTENSE